VRSFRQIKRRYREDLAFRVLAGNQAPDHVTIARFRARHQQALAGFLVQSLRLCAAAGLVRLGVIALDGTKVAANAADKANRTLDKLQTEVEQILREAAEIDQAEDRQHGPARGDELPAALASPSGRLARLRQAKAQLEAEAAERQRRYQQRVNELAAAARARGQQPKAHYRPRRRDEAPNPKAVANTTDPDSRFLHTRNGTVQGYNAQAVVTEGQIVVAAELTREANDLQQLQPMLQAVDQTLSAADVHQRPGMLLADSGYWSIANLTSIPDAPQLLVWPSRTGRTGKPRKDGKPSASRSDGLRAAMFAKLTSEAARPATRCASRPSNPSSGSSRSSRAPAGSAAAGWPPATRSGSCCPAPTTCSSSGATRTTDRHPHRPRLHRPAAFCSCWSVRWVVRLMWLCSAVWCLAGSATE
jgi:uncharacterized protein YoxC